MTWTWLPRRLPICCLVCLVGCTYSFVTVSLKNSRKVILDYKEQTKVKSRGLSQLNLMQYPSHNTKARGELTKRANPYIVRTFSKVSANPGGPTFGKYSKYQLIKFKPQEGKSLHAWNSMEETDDMFINMYASFLRTYFARENGLCLGMY